MPPNPLRVQLAAGGTGNPANVTVGESFTAVFAVTGAPANAASYEVAGSIPPGLTINNISGDTANGATVTISGTPTEAGEYTMMVRA